MTQRNGQWWARWSLRMAELHGLPDGEARMLNALTAHANHDGQSFVSEEKLAREAGRKPRSGRRLLARLTARGLVSTEQRGRKTPLRQLHDVLPVEQPVLDGFADTTGGAAASPAARSAGAARPPGRPANSLDTQPGQLGGRHKRTEGDVVVVDAPASADTGGHPRDVLHVVDPRLEQVMEIFDALPEPYRQFEPAAVESALRAHPTKDGIAAAHIVASKVHDGHVHTVHVSAILLGVLSRMPDPGAPGPTKTPPPSGGRRPRTEKPWDGALERAMGGAR